MMMHCPYQGPLVVISKLRLISAPYDAFVFALANSKDTDERSLSVTFHHGISWFS